MLLLTVGGRSISTEPPARVHSAMLDHSLRTSSTKWIQHIMESLLIRSRKGWRRVAGHDGFECDIPRRPTLAYMLLCYRVLVRLATEKVDRRMAPSLGSARIGVTCERRVGLCCRCDAHRRGEQAPVRDDDQQEFNRDGVDS